MRTYKKLRNIVLTAKEALWNLGKGQRDHSIFELCAALIADSICSGATGLSPDLHWAIRRDNKIIKVFRKATDDEVIDFIRRTVLVSIPLTDVCEEYAVFVVGLMSIDNEELMDRAMEPFLKNFEHENPTMN